MSTVCIDGAIINHLRMDVAHWWVCGLGMGLNIFGWGEVLNTFRAGEREILKKILQLLGLLKSQWDLNVPKKLSIAFFCEHV